MVTYVLAETAGERAGIKPGDILLTWTRGNAKGEIESPFVMAYLENEEAPRGPVKIQGIRNTENRTWLLGRDYWLIGVRPNLRNGALVELLEGDKLAKDGKIDDSIVRWRKIANYVEDEKIEWLRPWVLFYAADWFSVRRVWKQADALYEEAISSSVKAGPIVRGELFLQMSLSFESRDDLINAERYCEAALSEWRLLGPNSLSAAAGFSEVGRIALKNGDYSKAEEYLTQASSIRVKLSPDTTQVAQSFINLGVLYHLQGDLARAEIFYRKASAIEERIKPPSYNFSLAMVNLGELIRQRGDPTGAEIYYRRALAVAKKQKLDDQVATILSDLGECMLDQNKPNQSEKYQKSALVIRNKLAPDSVAVALVLADLGAIAKFHGNLAAAEEYYLQSLTIGEKQIPAPPEVAGFLKELGDLADQKKNFAASEDYYRRALAMMTKIAPKSLGQAEILAGLALTLRHERKVDLASTVYRDALDVLENTSARLGGMDQERSHYHALHSRAYIEYSNLLLEQRKPQLALDIVERSRARTLLEMLTQARVDITQGVDFALYEKRRSLQKSFNSLVQRRVLLLNRQHAEDELATIDRQVDALRKDYEEIEAEIRASNPGYASLTQASSLTTPDIQNLLDEDTLLLEYSLGEDRSHVFAVTRESIAVFDLPRRTEIDGIARHVYSLLTERDAQEKKDIEEQREANLRKATLELNRMVLDPIAALLPGKKLLMVSDGALRYIPFAVLPDPNLPAQPLLINHEIVNLPSASVVAELRRQETNRARPPNEIAILADPVFDASDNRITHPSNAIGYPSANPSSYSDQPALQNQQVRGQRLGGQYARSESQSASMDKFRQSVSDIGLRRRNGNVHFDRLIYTRTEAKNIMAASSAGKRKLALDFEASREMALSGSLAQYRIVHFATHGLIDNKHPELSGLVFSLVDRRGRPKDGFLDLQDIYNMKLPVDLVVLSACDTGLGEEISGEGFIGLTRGFIYAGASRIVSSLWSVPDEATAELMSRFYKAMERDGLRPASALRRAQEEIRKRPEWHSPFYWGGFQLQGEWR
ncbi:MAG TPA: CHAT domain-containing protein [Candidatus Angelobacter sp.]|nr:CHAT domain-containing protein [Candidatus Angelobacter sp.]